VEVELDGSSFEENQQPLTTGLKNKLKATFEIEQC
jgi:hypothetical protein